MLQGGASWDISGNLSAILFTKFYHNKKRDSFSKICAPRILSTTDVYQPQNDEKCPRVLSTARSFLCGKTGEFSLFVNLFFMIMEYNLLFLFLVLVLALVHVLHFSLFVLGHRIGIAVRNIGPARSTHWCRQQS